MNIVWPPPPMAFGLTTVPCSWVTKDLTTFDGRRPTGQRASY
ncbi:hypothetical protein STRAU_0474 [Streptomyces aurantiacus JA 4570]|uniref:Uncharacterized protein n=1 Tax=Streptomyces aurantiacus JA 4570 TaxID=1286094 RepID=S4AYS2_9ACTN|nr:hypothetical protein STRAU_0474 [Streptomyces aurantiacus JA 4570]